MKETLHVQCTSWNIKMTCYIALKCLTTYISIKTISIGNFIKQCITEITPLIPQFRAIVSVRNLNDSKY